MDGNSDLIPEIPEPSPTVSQQMQALAIQVAPPNYDTVFGIESESNEGGPPAYRFLFPPSYQSFENSVMLDSPSTSSIGGRKAEIFTVRLQEQRMPSPRLPMVPRSGSVETLANYAVNDSEDESGNPQIGASEEEIDSMENNRIIISRAIIRRNSSF